MDRNLDVSDDEDKVSSGRKSAASRSASPSTSEVTSKSDEAPPASAAPPDNEASAALVVGSRVRAFDSKSQEWYDAKVVRVRGDGRALIHFHGWSARYDLWLAADSPLVDRSAAQPPPPRRPARLLQSYAPGDYVFARWAGGKKYPAKVVSVEQDGQHTVRFYDGFEKALRKADLVASSEAELRAAGFDPKEQFSERPMVLPECGELYDPALSQKVTAKRRSSLRRTDCAPTPSPQPQETADGELVQLVDRASLHPLPSMQAKASAPQPSKRSTWTQVLLEEMKSKPNSTALHPEPILPVRPERPISRVSSTGTGGSSIASNAADAKEEESLTPQTSETKVGSARRKLSVPRKRSPTDAVAAVALRSDVVVDTPRAPPPPSRKRKPPPSVERPATRPRSKRRRVSELSDSSAQLMDVHRQADAPSTDVGRVAARDPTAEPTNRESETPSPRALRTRRQSSRASLPAPAAVSSVEQPASSAVAEPPSGRRRSQRAHPSSVAADKQLLTTPGVDSAPPPDDGEAPAQGHDLAVEQSGGRTTATRRSTDAVTQTTASDMLPTEPPSDARPSPSPSPQTTSGKRRSRRLATRTDSVEPCAPTRHSVEPAAEVAQLSAAVLEEESAEPVSPKKMECAETTPDAEVVCSADSGGEAFEQDGVDDAPALEALAVAVSRNDVTLDLSSSAESVVCLSVIGPKESVLPTPSPLHSGEEDTMEIDESDATILACSIAPLVVSVSPSLLCSPLQELTSPSKSPSQVVGISQSFTVAPEIGGDQGEPSLLVPITAALHGTGASDNVDAAVDLQRPSPSITPESEDGGDRSSPADESQPSRPLGRRSPDTFPPCWLVEFPWLRFEDDAMFCAPCRQTYSGSRKISHRFISGVRDRYNLGRTKTHGSSRHHMEAAKLADNLTSVKQRVAASVEAADGVPVDVKPELAVEQEPPSAVVEPSPVESTADAACQPLDDKVAPPETSQPALFAPLAAIEEAIESTAAANSAVADESTSAPNEMQPTTEVSREPSAPPAEDEAPVDWFVSRDWLTRDGDVVFCAACRFYARSLCEKKAAWVRGVPIADLASVALHEESNYHRRKLKLFKTPGSDAVAAAVSVKWQPTEHKCTWEGCDKVFRNDDQLGAHIRHFHTMESSEPPPPTRPLKLRRRRRRRSTSGSGLSRGESASEASSATDSTYNNDDSAASAPFAEDDAVFATGGDCQLTDDDDTDDDVEADEEEEEEEADVNVDGDEPSSSGVDGSPVSSLSDSDAVRCECGDPDENGFMVQCEICQLWQHGDCVHLAPETVPKFYHCYVCVKPAGIRASRREADRILRNVRDGVLPELMPSTSGAAAAADSPAPLKDRAMAMRRTARLAADAVQLCDRLRAVRVRMRTAAGGASGGQSWRERRDGASAESSTSGGGGGDDGRLRDEISSMHDAIEARLDALEADVGSIESDWRRFGPLGEDQTDAQRSEVLRTLLKDLAKIKKLSELARS